MLMQMWITFYLLCICGYNSVASLKNIQPTVNLTTFSNIDNEIKTSNDTHLKNDSKIISNHLSLQHNISNRDIKSDVTSLKLETFPSLNSSISDDFEHYNNELDSDVDAIFHRKNNTFTKPGFITSVNISSFDTDFSAVTQSSFLVSLTDINSELVKAKASMSITNNSENNVSETTSSLTSISTVPDDFTNNTASWIKDHLNEINQIENLKNSSEKTSITLPMFVIEKPRVSYFHDTSTTTVNVPVSWVPSVYNATSIADIIKTSVSSSHIKDTNATTIVNSNTRSNTITDLKGISPSVEELSTSFSFNDTTIFTVQSGFIEILNQTSNLYFNLQETSEGKNDTKNEQQSLQFKEEPSNNSGHHNPNSTFSLMPIDVSVSTVSHEYTLGTVPDNFMTLDNLSTIKETTYVSLHTLNITSVLIDAVMTIHPSYSSPSFETGLGITKQSPGIESTMLISSTFYEVKHESLFSEISQKDNSSPYISNASSNFSEITENKYVLSTLSPSFSTSSTSDILSTPSISLPNTVLTSFPSYMATSTLDSINSLTFEPAVIITTALSPNPDLSDGKNFPINIDLLSLEPIPISTASLFVLTEVEETNEDVLRNVSVREEISFSISMLTEKLFDIKLGTISAIIVDSSNSELPAYVSKGNISADLAKNDVILMSTSFDMMVDEEIIYTKVYLSNYTSDNLSPSFISTHYNTSTNSENAGFVTTKFYSSIIHSSSMNDTPITKVENIYSSHFVNPAGVSKLTSLFTAMIYTMNNLSSVDQVIRGESSYTTHPIEATKPYKEMNDTDIGTREIKVHYTTAYSDKEEFKLSDTIINSTKLVIEESIQTSYTISHDIRESKFYDFELSLKTRLNTDELSNVELSSITETLKDNLKTIYSPTKSSYFSSAIGTESTESHRGGKRLPFTTDSSDCITVKYSDIDHVLLSLSEISLDKIKQLSGYKWNERQILFQEINVDIRSNMITAMIRLTQEYLTPEGINRKICEIDKTLIHILNKEFGNWTKDPFSSDDHEMHYPFGEVYLLYVLPTPFYNGTHLLLTLITLNQWNNETLPIDFLLSTLNYYIPELKNSLNVLSVTFSAGLPSPDVLSASLEGLLPYVLCGAIVVTGIAILAAVVIIYRRRSRHSVHHLAQSKLNSVGSIQEVDDLGGLDLTPAVVILQEEKSALCDDEGWLAPYDDAPGPENVQDKDQDTRL